METAYDLLIKKIDDFTRKYYLNKIVRGVIWQSAIFIISYLLIILAEYYGYFGISIRTTLFYLFLGSQAILFYFLLGKHLFKFLKLGKIINHEQASEIIGLHFPEVKDKLLNTLQLRHQLNYSAANNLLIEASINQKINQLQPVPFVSAIKIRDNKKYLRYALIPLSAVIIIAFAAPSILKDGTERMIRHDKFFAKKAPFQFNIQNEKLVATQGDDLDLKIKLRGNEIPQDIYLEDGVNNFKLEKEDIINFGYLFRNLQGNKTFRLKAGEFFSEEYTIEVKMRPTIINTDVALIYPAYLNKKSETLKNPGDLNIPAGTIAKWRFFTENTSNLNFRIGFKKLVINKVNDTEEFNHTEKLIASTSYSISPRNAQALSADSTAYKINVIGDEMPSIEVNDRADSSNNKVLYFVGKANDDHGFSSLNFKYKIIKTEDAARLNKQNTTPIKFDRNSIQSNFFHFWNLKETNLKPGEEIEYYFEVADNDGVAGPKKTRSATKTFKLDSKDETLEKVEQNTQAVKQKMQSAMRQADNIQKEAKKLNQELINKKTLDYEQKKQVEQLLEKQQKLENLLKEVQKETKQNLFDRKELNADSEKLLEKQKEIQDLFDNVLNEKTKDLLKNLQKLLDQNQKDLTEDQLQKMQSDNKSLEKELDRILELYKKLEVEQKLNEAVQKLEELAKKQDDLSKQTVEKNSSTEDLKNKQEALKEAFSEVKKDLKEAKEKNDQLEDPEKFTNPEEEQKKIDEDMDDAKESIEKNNKKQAAQSQKSASQKMQQMAAKISAMQQQGEEEQSKVDQQELRQLLENLLKSSFDQEQVMVQLGKTNINDPKYTELGQKQREIKDNLKMVEDTLYSLSRRVPQIESTVNKEVKNINYNITEALVNLTERKTGEANRNQQFALTSINNLSLMLSEALQQLQNAMKKAKGGGQGKQKQPGMSELSKMQQQLNNNMQKAKEQMQQQGGMQPGQRKGNKGMGEQFAKMAQQQQMIRQALQDINQKMNKDGQGKLGNMEKIMKEMEQTESDLVNKRITQESLIRQKEIEIRLLEAEKSEREREQDTKKESNSGKEFAPNFNIILQEYQKLKQKETEIIKTMPPSLNSFYKSKINTYFKKLNSGN